MYSFGPTTEWRGDVYEGDFVNGLWEGKGLYKFANGDSYEGDYRDGKQCGYGRFNNASGERRGALRPIRFCSLALYRAR